MSKHDVTLVGNFNLPWGRYGYFLGIHLCVAGDTTKSITPRAHTPITGDNSIDAVSDQEHDSAFPHWRCYLDEGYK